jgi:two-component system chemotaxis sensor kinase CheA
MSEPDDIVREFLVESSENLDRLDRNLVALEKQPDDREILADVFRSIHTIKGTSGFLAFAKLEAVTHAGETLLARLRDGQLRLNPEITTVLLAMVDAVRQMLDSIAHSGTDGSNEYRELIGRLSSVEAADAPQTSAEPVPVPVETEVGDPEEFPPVEGRLGAVLVKQESVTPKQLARALEEQKQGNDRPLGEILLESGALHTQELQEALKIAAASRAPVVEEATVRIRVEQLDRLMNLVGELVLTRNRIQQWVGEESDSGLLDTSQRLNLITTELQEGVMKTRLQPIGNIWNKFPRVVRDIAHACGKQVRIELEGKDIELDKTIIEAIKDPLTHLVRNVVDHGIEPPEARRAARKAEEGLLRLRAFHEGGQVMIEISDDGAGLNLDRIRAKAIEKGLIRPDEATRMSEREICKLIFLPGFSTAEKVTNVSGRGVGMDVVRTNIEKIGGTVDLETQRGQGTTVRLKIPLTLAIIPALIVKSGGERYAIPQSDFGS